MSSGIAEIHELATGGKIQREGTSYQKVGEFFDLWKGTFYEKDDGNKITVAIKVMRGAPAHNDELHKRVRQKLGERAQEWQKLNHPNVLAFFGISNDFGYLPALIVAYCSNGNIIEFLKDKKESNDIILGLVCCFLFILCLDSLYEYTLQILQVARGLEYLHNNNIVHGDLRGSNIMVTDEGVPCLTDYELVYIIDHNEFTTSKIAGPARWTAPESLDPPETDNATPYTQKSDVYAFAMTMIEICTGKAPFSDRRNDSAVIFYVIDGGRPEMPETLSQRPVIRELTVHCWDKDPNERPSAKVIRETMEKELEASNVGFTSSAYRTCAWLTSSLKRFWLGT